MVDGDIWTECRMLMEATRFYDIDAVAEWACAKPITTKAGASSEQPAFAGAAEEAAPARKRAAGV
ncbi:MAG TPA: hydrolase, partial [Hyphomicrobium sp.]|nr:hydrolase [Hyphomicrobium sp.]